MSAEATSFLDAAERVLDELGEPTHYRAVTRIALDRGLLATQGKTPEMTLNAQVAVEIKRQGDASTFVRTSPGVFALRRWLDEGQLDPSALAPLQRPMVPHYPDYDRVRDVLPAWEGAPDGAITRMKNAIRALQGTPQDQMDWTDPATWIDQRLDGESREWARTTWDGSGQRVSPRYVTGHWLLIRNYKLLRTNSSGVLELTTDGRDFLQDPDGETVRRVDREQGLLRILRLVGEAGNPAPAEIVESWAEFLQAESNVRSESATRSYLYHRLRNLLQRGFVERSGKYYSITPRGIDYLGEVSEAVGEEDVIEVDLATQILRLQEQLRQQVREGIKTQIAAMDPYAFERLVQQLLDSMEYQDTETTSRSGDGGADVVGTIEAGISEIREVIQVKRQKNNVGRPVLDSLRGALYRFDAVQGTIITTAKFTREAQAVAYDRGAPPIKLIDGDQLVKLLIENGIGVKTRQIELWSLDSAAFEEESDEI